MVSLFSYNDIYDKDDDLDLFVQAPNECPYCRKSFNANGCDLFHYYQRIHNIAAILYSGYLCPTCEKLFVIRYMISCIGNNSDQDPCPIYESIPHPDSVVTFSKAIEQFSKRYCDVYRQAVKAENDGLTEICGMGYRKALEILIKDYAIKLQPEKEEQICKTMLKNCIEKYITEERVQGLAKGAAWLGNNETHYKHIDSPCDIEDMKRFIKSVETLIECDLNFEKAEELRQTVENHG